MGTRFRCHVCLLLCLITGTELAAQTSNWTEIQKRYKLGVEAVQAGHDAEAEEDFRAILRLDPKNASAHANLGSIAFRHGDFTQASKEFRAALDLEPSLWNATAFLGMSEFALGKNERLAAGCVGVIEQEAKEVEKPKPEWYGDKEQSMYGRVSENCGKGKHGGV